MGGDRIDWIFDGEVTASLEDRYDAWASTYDTDHDAWGWRGPDLVAAAAVGKIGVAAARDTIVDAGCGTGMVGNALRNGGWRGRIIGLDLSHGMLDVAARSGAYDELVKCSLYDVPLVDASAAATVSSGVFTLGHVGGEALAELCRITRPGGVVTVTQRLDTAETFGPHIDRLRSAGTWVEIERTMPEALHPEREDHTEQIVITWRVRPSPDNT
jgi:ubiquinone/menaquinone biosynthesis C-methylase UbiE